jgi:ankyrin repeat protein
MVPVNVCLIFHRGGGSPCVLSLSLFNTTFQHCHRAGKYKMSTANGNDDNKDLLATGTQEDAQRLSMVDQLVTACESGDVNNASRLLAALPEVNLNTIKWSEDDEGELTLLTHAASKGHAEICQMLLDRGADVNQRSEGVVRDSGVSTLGITPLIYACWKGRVDAVQILLAVDGIDVNYRKDNGVTALYTSCAMGHFSVIKMLLAVDGIQVNQANGDGWTPLNMACQNGHSKVVKMLLTVAGIQVNQANNEKATPLWMASQEGHVKEVKMLLAVDGIQVNQTDEEGWTPLNISCHNGHLKAVEMLLAADGIQVNKATDEEATPLYIACEKGHLKVVNMLLAVEDIQVNQANHREVTPLFMACQNGHSKVVKMLLTSDGIHVNQANNDGWTPFIMAVSNRHLDIVVQLLQHGVGHNSINEWFSINKTKPSGRIALYKYALLLPQQHQPLLDFHSCVLSSTNALVPTSALKVFKTIWPPLIGFTIESFLLPTKQTRRTMQQVVSRFNATLNAHNEKGHTQLYSAVYLTEVESVRFLILQDGILINKISKIVYEEEGEDDEIHYETPLHLADDLVREGAADYTVSDDAGTERMYIAGLLRDAGGVI